jgi:hypothetical protein
MRTDSIRRIATIGVALLLAACATSEPSPSPATALPPTPSAAAAGQSTTASTPTPMPTQTPAPRPSGTLLVWQLDGTDGTTATTESVFRLDLSNGATTPVVTIPVNETTCCPTAMRLSSDRRTALLFAGNYRGAIDLTTGAFTRASGRIPHGTVAVSSSGDRLAWVDDVTGTSESIVIGGLDGKRLQRIELPAGSFASVPSWTADDGTLLVTTLLPVRTGSATGIRLASTIACCSIDRGLQATHVLVVPLDGSAVRDIYDDAVDVQADLKQPVPTSSFGSFPGLDLAATRNLQVIPAGDSRSALIVTQACPAQHVSHGGSAVCTADISTIDTQTAARTPLPVPPMDILSAGWSPDGRRLSLLGSEGGGPTGLYVLDRDGGSFARLSAAEPDLMAWSGDSAWIAFWRLDPAMADGQDRVQVWVAPSTGGDARFVAAHASAEWLKP